MTIEVGSIVEGVVTGITNFGAFVELPDGQTGLVHISEVADAYVRDVKDYLKDNDRVTVMVIAIENGKIGLSIKQAKAFAANALSHLAPNLASSHVHHSRRNDKSADFEERLAKFMKESDERQQDLRRATESKRGGRGSRRSY